MDKDELAGELVTIEVPLAFYEWLATIERDVRVHDLIPQEIADLAQALRPTEQAKALTERAVGERDGCELCLGAKGGVPGNENRMGDIRVCDYCTSALLPYLRQGTPATDEGLRELLREARRMAGVVQEGIEDAQCRRTASESCAALIAHLDAALSPALQGGQPHDR